MSSAGTDVEAARPSLSTDRSRRGLLALVFGILLAAGATRFVRLGERPFHHDESIHAYQSYTLSKDGNWRYDPAYHGPFLYYANALVYKVFGVSDTTARALPAVFGLLLIAFAFPLARWFGREAAVAYALLVLISPHFAYFSRFIREDLYSLVFTLGTILAFRRFLETDRARWLYLSASAFALAGVTKENAYMTGVLFVAFGLWAFAEGAVRAKALAPAFARPARWVRAHIVPLVTAGIVFLGIWALLYTAFGRYPGDWLAIPKAVRYWMGQHAIARIPGPWYYYFPQLAYYETGILLAAVFAFRRRLLEDPFFRFLVFWAAGSLAIYAWAREKVPWLTVHPLLPITILAGIGMANLWRERREGKARIALAVVALLLAINASGMWLACFRYGAYDVEKKPRHGELLAYVQTSVDLIRALGVLDRVRGRVPEGQPLITVAGEASWPLTWYLRDTPTTWTSRIEQASTPVIVADWDAEGALQKQLAARYDARRVPIRAWWFPEKSAGTPQNPGPHPTPRDFWRWWLFHELWSPIGSQDATFYVRKDLAGGGALEPLDLPIQDTSGRDYPSDALPIAAEREWGGPGASPGQLAEPRGLAADSSGNLYVADTKNSRIQVFDASGNPLRQFGRKGAGDGELNEPCGVAIDPEGDVWVADTWNHRIVRFGPQGEHRASFGDPDGNLFGPRAVVVSRGAVLVADTGNKRIVRFDREGRKLGAWGGAGMGPGQFVEPVGLAANAAGDLFVADTGNHRVQVFDAEGKFLRQFPVFGWKDFYTEPYLVAGPSDSLFASDSWSGRIAWYDASGTLKKSWKPTTTWKSPTGIAIDPFGSLTVSDRGTHRIFSWSLSGVMR